jgi:serine/threonine protein kinase
MIGQTLGHYRILEKIGAGGMGVVYRARDERLDREVALKVLPAGTLADETARERFRKEALALSRLNHPHICTIYEVGESSGETFIAMEFVEGRTLAALAQGEGLPVDATMRYGIQIADALAHAHERDIIHRDLKGSNVIITPDGRAKVLDFGLAKRTPGGETAATRTQGLTEAGLVVGTLHYMAPEVLRGSPADARSDIWALGVMLK